MSLRVFADGVVFADVEEGDGSWCVFLHGWGRDRSDFDLLAKAVRVSGVGTASIDLPGFGASPAPDSACGTSEYADTVASVVSDLVDTAPTGSAVTIVGHSFGGRVAVQLAARRPPWLGSLVLIGTPLLRSASGRRTSVRYRAVRNLSRLGILSDKSLERARHRYGSADYRAATGVMRDVLVRSVNEDYGHLLPRVAVPTWMIWGRDDTAAPLRMAQDASKLFRHLVQLRVVDGAQHDVHRTASHVVAAFIIRAVAGDTSTDAL